VRAFARLCEIAEQNGLVVEIMTNPAGESAIWVFPDEQALEFVIDDVSATMRIGIVATPFMANLPYDGASPQLIAMLAGRGYPEGGK
jgi:hypothetical protein